MEEKMYNYNDFLEEMKKSKDYNISVMIERRSIIDAILELIEKRKKKIKNNIKNFLEEKEEWVKKA